MDYRPLYRVLDPESPDPAARTFRLVHHAMAALGIAIVLAETMAAVQAEHSALLAAGFDVIGAFFVAEYVLRLAVAPAKPGHEHLAPWRARLLWAVSLAGIYDLICALPGILFMTERAWAALFGFIWAFKYVRYSPGLASLGRVVRNERQALLSVLLGFGIVLLTAASFAYLFERDANPAVFGSIPAALWWAIVTLTTTGYGDVVPSTIAGRILGGTVMIGGILVFALWSGILANGYARELRRREFLLTWELVAKVPFFHNIGAALIAEVARLLRPREYPEGAIVMRRGQPGDCMYFIADGEVEIQLPAQNVYLGSGEFVGEVALLTGAPRNATVVTTRPSTLLVLDIVDFHELLAHHPELARIIHEEAQRRRNEPAASPAPRAEPALAVDKSA
jgi:voltage-gated potassium channel